jgi:hypothetical protein
MVKKLTTAQLTTLLNNLPPVVDRHMEKGMDQVLDKINKRAKDLVDPGKPSIYPKTPYETGAMQEAIYTRKETGRHYVGGFLGVDQPRNPKSPNKYYPFFVVYGLGHNRKYGKRDFVWDAIRMERTNTRKILTEAFLRGVQEVSR